MSSGNAPQKIVVHRDGSIETSSQIVLDRSVEVLHNGISLTLGDTLTDASGPSVGLPSGASVDDVASGLRAVGAGAEEIVAIFEQLRASGVLTAEVELR